MDNCYVTGKFEIVKGKEAEEEQSIGKVVGTTLVSEDRSAGPITVHIVECNGTGDDGIVKRVVTDMEESGYVGMQHSNSDRARTCNHRFTGRHSCCSARRGATVHSGTFELCFQGLETKRRGREREQYY